MPSVTYTITSLRHVMLPSPHCLECLKCLVILAFRLKMNMFIFRRSLNEAESHYSDHRLNHFIYSSVQFSSIYICIAHALMSLMRYRSCQYLQNKNVLSWCLKTSNERSYSLLLLTTKARKTRILF